MKQLTNPEGILTEAGEHDLSLIQQLFHHKKQRRKTIKHILKNVERYAAPDPDIEQAVHNFIGTGPLRLYRKALVTLMSTWLDQATDINEIREMKHDYQYLYELIQSIEEYQLKMKYTA
ncbi:MAG: hypothetical protein AAGF85_00660 [Bacteroidota bacterium]